MSRLVRLSSFLVALLAGLTLVPQTAFAHIAIQTPATTTSGFYDYRWQTSTSVQFRWTPAGTASFNAGNGVINGAQQIWNSAQTGLTMYFGTAWPNDYDPYSCPMKWSNGHVAYQKNGIHASAMQGYLALTAGCSMVAPGNNYYELYDANLIFNSSLPAGYSWNYVASLPTSHQYDLYSVAAHEWGHGAGSIKGGTNKKTGHFVGKGTDGHGAGRDLGACPGGPDSPNNDSTMCDDGIAPGVYWPWDLAPHDIATVESAY